MPGTNSWVDILLCMSTIAAANPAREQQGLAGGCQLLGRRLKMLYLTHPRFRVMMRGMSYDTAAHCCLLERVVQMQQAMPRIVVFIAVVSRHCLAVHSAEECCWGAGRGGGDNS
jgi:hypothetical protein